ncbi:unnamed protein product (macronuclear) [Paramecium tetraurelia]|uniref:TLDc domain-containing protein n=1 Tax=Paramecium tetraurelia TaxID=5888 RepID=A0E346_PARTE|nr:uncharacterized protein GSPATT00022886001 [Paramecium tetraurelia]CAK89713.1 unnamed protein product [Paramecium tetraurelia]|eukprot:XP_001457110.1 hypothetical protein (macronuclear) [Paramecium tetraurelia strain d4-2]
MSAWERYLMKEIFRMINLKNQPSERHLKNQNISASNLVWMEKIPLFQMASQNTQKFNWRDLIQKIEANLKDIQLTIDKIINELKEEVYNILNNKSNFRKQLEKVTQFSQFKEIIESLNNTQQTITHDVVNQVETKLLQIFMDLEKDSSSFNREIKDYSASNKINKINFSGFQQFKDQIKQFLHLSLQFQGKIPYDQFIVSEDYFNNLLLSKISLEAGKKIQKTNLIFNEQQQNLNCYSFWKNVENKSNLLMIFKSNSGYIFGAYTPLKWVYENKRMVWDSSKLSFLFSYTHKTIHQKSNNQTCAIKLQKLYGPCFNQDLEIEGDFQKGSSNLGHAYKKQAEQNASTHLFGQETPNIIKCQIFEIIFQ